MHDLPAPERRRWLDAIRRALAALDEVRLAYAFGSFPRGEPFRDIDVGVLLAEPLSWRVPGRIADAVRAAVPDAPAPVDVVPLNDAPASFRKNVADGGVVLYERVPGAALDFWVRACSEWMDFTAWRRAHGLDA